MFTNKSRSKPWRLTTQMSATNTSISNIMTNPKGRLKRLEEQHRIYRQNMHLLGKLRDVDTKKKREKPSHHIGSLNIKNRMDTQQKIITENYHLILRLQSQKSRYSSQQCRRPDYSTKKRVFTAKSRGVSAHGQSSQKQYVSTVQRESTYETPMKLLLYTELLTLKNKLYHFELSQVDFMYHALLHELSTNRNFILKLVEQTGYHLISLIKSGRIDFSQRIMKRQGNFVLVVPFHPFTRQYVFTPIQLRKQIYTQPEQTYEDETQALMREFQEEQPTVNWKNDSKEEQSSLKPSEEQMYSKESDDQANERLDAQPSLSSSHHDIFDDSVEQPSWTNT